MKIRYLALAAAALLGTACKTSSATSKTAQSSPGQPSEATVSGQGTHQAGEQPATGSPQGTASVNGQDPGASGSASMGSGAADSQSSAAQEGSSASGSASAGAQGDTGGTQAQAQGDAGSMHGQMQGDTMHGEMPGDTGAMHGQAQGEAGSMHGETQGDTSAQQGDRAGQMGGPMGGSTGSQSGASAGEVAHEGDQLLTGKVSKISKDSITIKTAEGESRTLKLVDQTEFQLDGRQARRSDIRQGQDVRASYGEQDGAQVAVKVDAKKKKAAKSHKPAAPGASGSGTTGSGATGAGGSGGGTGGDTGGSNVPHRR